MPAEIAIAIPGSTRRAASVAIAAFSTCCSADLATKPGSYEARPEIAVAPPWTFSSRPVVVEDLEVAADRHVRDVELARKLGDADRAGLADPVEDQCLALTGQHPLRSQYPAPGRLPPRPRVTRRASAQRAS